MQRYEKPMGAVSSLATVRPLVNFLISPAIKSNGGEKVRRISQLSGEIERPLMCGFTYFSRSWRQRPVRKN